MPVKSLVEIDVNDAAFQKFNALFQKYQAALARTPQQWAAVGGQISNAQKGVNAVVSAISAQTFVLAQVAAQHGTIANQASATARAWQQIGAQVKSVAGPIGAITRHILSWSTVTGAVSGLLGLGGLWGISRMAGDVAEGRRSSLGLGVTYGQEKAFNLQMGRFVDQGFLGNVAGAMQLGSPGYGALMSAGISPQYMATHNAAEVAAELLRKLPGVVGNDPRSPLIGTMLQGTGLNQIIDTESVRRLLGVSPGERARQFRKFAEGSTGFDLPPRTQRAWNDLTTQLSAAALGIENTFVKGLTPLAKPLERLSTAVEGVVQKFLDAAKNEGWIDKLGTGIEGLADTLLKPEFRQGVSDFVSAVGTMSAAMTRFARWWGGGSGTGGEPSKDSYTSLMQRTAPLPSSWRWSDLRNPDTKNIPQEFRTAGVPLPPMKPVSNYIGRREADPDDYRGASGIDTARLAGVLQQMALLNPTKVQVSVEPGSSVNAAVDALGPYAPVNQSGGFPQ
jgi:hypothetical protein